MPRYSVIAARDGDVYHDEVEASSQEEAEAEARAQLASDWGMTPELQEALNESDPTLFDAELDGFAVDPILPPDNGDLRDDIWALHKVLDYASEVFANSADTSKNKAADDQMLTSAYEAWDAIKSRLQL